MSNPISDWCRFLNACGVGGNEREISRLLAMIGNELVWCAHFCLSVSKWMCATSWNMHDQQLPLRTEQQGGTDEDSKTVGISVGNLTGSIVARRLSSRKLEASMLRKMTTYSKIQESNFMNIFKMQIYIRSSATIAELKRLARQIDQLAEEVELETGIFCVVEDGFLGKRPQPKYLRSVLVVLYCDDELDPVDAVEFYRKRLDLWLVQEIGYFQIPDDSPSDPEDNFQSTRAVLQQRSSK